MPKTLFRISTLGVSEASVQVHLCERSNSLVFDKLLCLGDQEFDLSSVLESGRHGPRQGSQFLAKIHFVNFARQNLSGPTLIDGNVRQLQGLVGVTASQPNFCDVAVSRTTVGTIGQANLEGSDRVIVTKLREIHRSKHLLSVS